MEHHSNSDKYQYQSAQWSRLLRRNTLATTPSHPPSSIATGQTQLPNHIDLVPILLPQQSLYHHAQLAHYNRLISSGRSSRLQALPLPPILSAQHIQAVSGSRPGSSGGNTAQNYRPSSRGGHGNKTSRNISQGERMLIAEKANPATMPPKKLQLSQVQQQLPSRPQPQQQNSSISHQSSSVPSTPHQRPRKFSFESREPSPNATGSHSPRSTYSEPNATLPSQQQGGRFGRGCRYETFTQFQKRRMPYSLGSEKLPQLDSKEVKSRLAESEEKKMSKDMRELYDRLKPTIEGESNRKKLVDKLEKLFNDEWPGHDIRVHVFGSSGNLLCTDESDVDICIVTKWKELHRVCMIAELLAKHGMKEVICVSQAKVPIVKVFDPVLKLHCDMNVNNTLALENTRMIKTYVQIDPRVRPLAMIIKHWTKRRIVNDAAFGATLSSYTWICMIINFLQSRKIPILPSLHQRPHLKSSVKEGQSQSDFADDLSALKDFGKRNQETLGQLLFAFFRFYGHEFDYDKSVVSVRSGKQITKTEKNWQFGNNNFLCVEEPFNTGRNLGNTADETSFRGLHIELRRAFDLISVGKIDECCQLYEFPPEERSQTFRRPAPAKPAILRSASQSQPNRGGRGGGRGGKHSNRNGGSNRRASAGTFDNQGQPGFTPAASNQSTSNVWQQQQAQLQLHDNLYQTFNFLQNQEHSLRLQLYNQSQAYMQAHAARANGSVPGYVPLSATASSHTGHQQSSDRNRTNSFDQGPMTAPIVRMPDMFYYPMSAYPHIYNRHQTPSTNPPSPSTGSAVPDLRRSVHRLSTTNGSDIPPNSSNRSQSQPARSPSKDGGVPVYVGLGPYPRQQHNGQFIPKFQLVGGNADMTIDTASSINSSPEELTPRKYVGYYVSDTSSNVVNHDPGALTIPPFSDVQRSHGRRRQSQDQLPPSVLDRMRSRTSRSPSPLGHDAASFPFGTYASPLPALSTQQGVSSNNVRALNGLMPAVVNGSSIPAQISIPQWQAAVREGSEEPSIDSESSHSFGTGSVISVDQSMPGQMTPRESRYERYLEGPMVVNGSYSTPPEASPVLDSPPIINGTAFTPSSGLDGLVPLEATNGELRYSPNSRNHFARQNGGIPTLDIGTSSYEGREDLPHLSPVYETSLPSPTTSRKFEPRLDRKPTKAPAAKLKDGNLNAFQLASKLTPVNGSQVKQAVPEVKSSALGHVRGSRSEGGGSGSTWQQIQKGKKKGGNSSEKPPKLDSERKGG
ncbi:zinc finger protein-like protein [Calycina marina]|uniref:polynucleotide adenylyltransferase n=1 Tax=Calycina marina TaxID=1763456 RepID=A0A9P8CFB3_9HELO|nr:zinc finger protein-like protein [Calycina marina]